MKDLSEAEKIHLERALANVKARQRERVRKALREVEDCSPEFSEVLFAFIRQAIRRVGFQR